MELTCGVSPDQGGQSPVLDSAGFKQQGLAGVGFEVTLGAGVACRSWRRMCLVNVENGTLSVPFSTLTRQNDRSENGLSDRVTKTREPVSRST
jgi:hypothetical protein